jgi:integrase
LNGRNYRATTQTALKQQAKDIEARDRSRFLDGRHGIRRQPDISFHAFSTTYLRDHAELHHRDKGRRAADIVVTLNRTFGRMLLHEITGLRIEQWKRERLAGKWRAHGQVAASQAVRPATVNREMDTLRSIFSKAVKWKKLIENPCVGVQRLKVDNRRTRILTDSEQAALIAAFENRTPCRAQSIQRLKMQVLVQLALVTGARLGELLALTWDDCTDGFLTFLETITASRANIPCSPAVEAILRRLPRQNAFLFTNPATGEPYSTNGVQHIFRRAVLRAAIETGDVTFHTLRHTALSRMIAAGHSDHTVMAISGHSTTKMLEHYTHPTQDLKVSALESGAWLARLSTN